MSLTFANAGLAALLLLGAVPVLIHLFARSRPPAFAFPSVAFLRRVARRTARVKRPQEWLLLAIRTLLALALNLVVAAVLTVVLRAAKVDEGVDQTSPQDYHADHGDPGVEEELTPESAVHA